MHLKTGTKIGSYEIILANDYSESNAAISPNGQWLAHQSLESG